MGKLSLVLDPTRSISFNQTYGPGNTPLVQEGPIHLYNQSLMVSIILMLVLHPNSNSSGAHSSLHHAFFLGQGTYCSCCNPFFDVQPVASSHLLSHQVHCYQGKAFQPQSITLWLSSKATFLNRYDVLTGHNGYLWTLVKYLAH
ncbi:hypothetical protein DSO57_1028076 [Entomophthora muscae]|uniref:Uncharacterized protein n=1 Tax=Entomophthora muscae TaxID=34485 RepID=A0ACC2RSJ8_9FUNG|nr:hypothetical protein DSO57_1028076 [Entomophthora muscae]